MLERLRHWVARRQGGTLLLALTYVALCTLLRLGLLVACAGSVSWGPATYAAFLTGLAFDVPMAWLLTLPFAGLSALLGRPPLAAWRRWILVVAWCLGAWIFAFWKVSEILFWEEFGVRFNFIAVDYLVYTVEVVKNIVESYPLPLILLGVSAVVAGLVAGWRALGLWQAWLGATEHRRRAWHAPAPMVMPILGLVGVAYGVGRVDHLETVGHHTTPAERITAGLRHMGDLQPAWANTYDTELGKNGEYAFLAAFWANEMEWAHFYPSLPDPVGALRSELAAQGESALAAPGEGVRRRVESPGPVRRLNVIQITVESLSAEFLGCYGEPAYAGKNLTPNLDRIARESLWFRRCYASGTRTVRGMEALTLSVPPIPGQSILRRKGCENLVTLGSVLARQGYDTAFIYGGDGFFDNMNYFFSANGYRVVDEPAKRAEGVTPTFANAWGACDEDAFAWSMAEADRAHAAGKPFHHFIMSTSNHRPYTWPAGRIDPRLTGRLGGVAYSDYAIGAFLEAARAKPWFKDTVFVIVADHCASVAGRQELEVRKYEIPLFIWSPAHIPPRRVDTLVAQLDLAPTLLSLLGMSYDSRFVGSDALSPGYKPRVFISNYQKVGLIRDGRLTVLKPVRQSVGFKVDLATGRLEREPAPLSADAAATQAYYQGTDWLFNHGGLSDPDPR